MIARNLILSSSILLLLVIASGEPRSEHADQAPSSPSNLHQWGAVTLFHGLPSDHVRTIAQDPDGAMWFGTDSGLAKYDGRRVQKLVAGGPAAARVRALKLDRDGLP